MKRVALQPAYVLHRRSYRESSFLLEIFTPEYGRLSVLAKGVRKARSSMQALLQPFTPLLISWSGKSELMTVTHVETNGELKRLQGECLYAGFYLNELLMYLLQKWDAHSNLYAFYVKTLTALLGSSEQKCGMREQKILRLFEKFLLQELGYGLLPKSKDQLDTLFAPDKFYQFIPEQGFVLSEMQSSPSQAIFSGRSLLSLAKEDWEDEESLLEAKKLMRFVLVLLLGARTLHSRRLFVSMNEGLL